VKAAIARSEHGPDYGYLWWRNEGEFARRVIAAIK